MGNSITYHLANLASFAGREGRRTFWLWVLAIALINIVVSIGLSATFTASAVGAAIQGTGADDTTAIEALVLREMLPNMPTMIWAGVAMSLFNCAMMAAAFVRRLHDGGFPGLIVLVPLAAVALNLWFQIEQLGQIEELLQAALNARSAEDLADLQRDAGLRGLVSWIPLLVVAGFGLVPSKSENRWGPPPAD
ncbi:hypothetical protein A6F68_02350 [Tsuneonella dongtanensis]|uniref:DUF805 domain-containing protein n=1 Tax=Tsuneonella dongtanensis TaxID=692370 RepID=A0A1B2AFB6_9SPHN|nr:DUF805 domain-containing protein [Tsuneonella dongtanensis]ANY20849.1 hypothetical protein A6F68_02350 [Tsuneonella dongtanensis]